MTTVVYDGNILAADSQSTKRQRSGSHCPDCNTNLTSTHRFRNKIRNGHSKKIIKFNDEVVKAWASAGNVPTILALDVAITNNVDIHVAVSMLNWGDKGEMHSHQVGCSTIIIGEKSVWKMIIDGQSLKIELVKEFPVIVGSGSSVASLAIKRLGLNAIGALALAIDSDKYSGGNINYIDFSVDDHSVQQYNWTGTDTDELLLDILK